MNVNKVLLILTPTIYGIIFHYAWNSYPAIVITIGISLTIHMLYVFFDLIDY